MLTRGTGQGAETTGTSEQRRRPPLLTLGERRTPSTMVSEAKNRQGTGKARAQGAGGNEEGEGSPGW